MLYLRLFLKNANIEMNGKFFRYMLNIAWDLLFAWLYVMVGILGVMIFGLLFGIEQETI